MSKSKTNFVAALVAGMLAAIIIGLHKLAPDAFRALAGAFALIGYVYTAIGFRRWLGGETARDGSSGALVPPTVRGGERYPETRKSAPARSQVAQSEGEAATVEEQSTSDAWTGDYDTIREEMEGMTA